MAEFNEDISRVPLRPGESLYLYIFEHPTSAAGANSYRIYAHSQKEAEDEFRRDWDHKFEPKLQARTPW